MVNPFSNAGNPAYVDADRNNAGSGSRDTKVNAYPFLSLKPVPEPPADVVKVTPLSLPT